MTTSLGDLKRQLDRLWAGIDDHCRTCSDRDCIGAIPVLPDEEEAVLDASVETVQMNGEHGPIFLNSYRRTAAGLALEKNACPYRDPVSGQCRIHRSRPLACHMYPLALEAQPDGTIAWVLHRDCAYVRAAEQGGGIDSLLDRIRRWIAGVAPAVRERLIENERKVAAITAWPDGPNRLFIVEVVDSVAPSSSA